MLFKKTPQATIRMPQKEQAKWLKILKRRSDIRKLYIPTRIANIFIVLLAMLELFFAFKLIREGIDVVSFIFGLLGGGRNTYYIIAAVICIIAQAVLKKISKTKGEKLKLLQEVALKEIEEGLKLDPDFQPEYIDTCVKKPIDVVFSIIDIITVITGFGFLAYVWFGFVLPLIL